MIYFDSELRSQSVVFVRQRQGVAVKGPFDLNGAQPCGSQ
jgi:hypothetical protein